MRMRAWVLVVAAIVATALPAGATWSIVVVDSATGEVAVASATCLESTDLLRYLPVVVVGKGAAAAQSQIDQNGANRKKIWDALHAGVPPADIIELVKVGDVLKCSRQYGIADPSSAAGFTGGCALQFKKHVTGTAGTLAYAIQGNVLTGLPVVEAAEQALLATPGRLSDRLMAAMEAARAMGGDGRCSCLEGGPTACGAPPPTFEKSAHVAFVVVARIGDQDGVCNAAVGCANGSYWLKLQEIGVLDDPDPVQVLATRYDEWVERMRGLPDALLSTASWDQPVVRGDGHDTRELRIALHDLLGEPLTAGGASIDVAHAPGSAGLSSRWSTVDHGDGSYTVRVQAGSGAGTDRYAIRVSGGGGRGVVLYPYPALEHVVSGRR